MNCYAYAWYLLTPILLLLQPDHIFTGRYHCQLADGLFVQLAVDNSWAAACMRSASGFMRLRQVAQLAPS